MLDKGIIAVSYDCDKTLIPVYMQKVLFDEYQIDGEEFWAEKNKMVEEAQKQGINYDGDLAYLNLILRYVNEGKFEGLSNSRLFELGKNLPTFEGLPQFFEITKTSIEKEFKGENITVEQYIISSGIKKVIEGCFGGYVDGIYGAEYIENQNGVISEISRVIDHTGKRNILHQLNKGCNKNLDIDVNSSIPDDFRRIPFRNMIYVADGPNDIVCFKGVNDGGGYSLAVYDPDPENSKSLEQAIQLRTDERVFGIIPGDFTSQSHTSKLILQLMRNLAKKDIERRKEKLSVVVSAPPGHLS